MTHRVPDNFIQTADLGRKIAQRYNLRDPAPIVSVSPELVPVTIVDALATDEISANPTVRPAVGGGSQTALALGAWQFKNNPASGILARVLGVLVGGPAAVSLELRKHNTNIGSNLATLDWRNDRIPGAPRCDLRYSDEAAGVGVLMGTFRVPNTIWLPLDLLVAEGEGWVVQSLSPAATTNTCWFWEEFEKGA